MIKRLALLSVLVAGNASAQQNIDISEKELAAGAAKSRLSALARQAEISGKRVVVTAPQHLHAQVAAALRAGGKAEIVMKDGFYENVLVRIEDKAVEPPKPEVKAPAAPKPVAVVPRVARTPTPAPVEVAPPPPPAAVAAVPAPAPPPQVTAPPVVEPKAAAPAPVAPVLDDAVEKTPAPPEKPRSAPPAPTPVAAKPSVKSATVAVVENVLAALEPSDVSPVRSALEKRYNEGRRISETLEPARLRIGDVIYTGNGAAVVVRREGPSLLRFWLDGSLNLNQSGIEFESGNKYRVIGATIR